MTPRRTAPDPRLPPAMALVTAGCLPSSRWDLGELCRAVEDWDEVVGLARRHGVVALLHRALAARPDGEVPGWVLSQLKRRRDGAARRALELTAELVRVTDRMRGRGVDSLAFKGPALSARLFDSPVIRPPGDLDLLIDPRDLTVAAEVLEGLGYYAVSPKFTIHDGNRAMVQRVRADAEYLHAERGVRVELHWRWQRNPWLMRFDAERVWGGAGHQALAGRSVAVPEGGELFLYLCVHGGRHQWESLKWLADIAGWIEREGAAMDWAALMARAEAVGAARSLVVTVELLEALGGEALPSPLRSSAATRAMVALFVERLAWPRRQGRATFRELARTLMVEWRMSDSWGGRLRGIVWARFLQPNDNDVATLELPPRLVALYFPLKPFLWLARRLRKPF